MLGGIVLAGGIARCYRLDLTWFYLDQVRDISTATAIISGRKFPLLGPNVGWTDGNLGPLYFYLIAPPFALSNHPLTGQLFVVILNLVAIVLLYDFAQRHFGPVAAVTASALFAVSPLAAVTSRVLWNPAVLPLFTVLFVRSLYALIVDAKPRAMVPLLGVLAMVPQFHMTAVALVVVAMVAIAVYRPRVSLRHLTLGLALAVVLNGLYLLYEVTHGFRNTRAFAHFMRADQAMDAPRALVPLLCHLLTLFASALKGFGVEAPLSPVFLAVFYLLYRVESALFVLGALTCMVMLRHRRLRLKTADPRTSRRAALLLLWLAVPVLLLGLKRTTVWWYYLDILYPAPFLVAGIGCAAIVLSLRRAPSSLRRLASGISVAGLVALVVSQLAFTIGFQRQIARTGENVLDPRRLAVSSGPLPIDLPLISLPLAYRLGILRTLLETFGLNEESLWRRVHGRLLGLPAENALLLQHWRWVSRGQEITPLPPHYVVENAGKAVAESESHRASRIGPYIIREYVPCIDYQSWAYTKIRVDEEISDVSEAHWTPSPLPAVALDADPAPGKRWYWKGIIDIAPGRRRLRLAVNVIGAAPVDIPWIQIARKQRIAAVSSKSMSPSFYWRARATFGLETASTTGRQQVLVAVSTRGRLLSFDVYETNE
jgi:dolichyl-phosphate-mannose-protein mannosyltransferase